MKQLKFSWQLTLALAVTGLSLTACMVRFEPNYDYACNIRAYISSGTEDYIKYQQYRKNSGRVAILPFDVPESFSPWLSKESEGLGRKIAYQVAGEVIRHGALPLVEIYDLDWPGKREEFFKGNYSALQYVRNAGYDYLILGYLDLPAGTSTLRFYNKLIDVKTNVTIWYGTTTVVETLGQVDRNFAALGILNERPGLISLQPMLSNYAECFSRELIWGEPLEAMAEQVEFGEARAKLAEFPENAEVVSEPTNMKW